MKQEPHFVAQDNPRIGQPRPAPIPAQPVLVRDLAGLALQPTSPQKSRLLPSGLLGLQRTLGNRTVAQLLARGAAPVLRAAGGQPSTRIQLSRTKTTGGRATGTRRTSGGRRTTGGRKKKSSGGTRYISLQYSKTAPLSVIRVVLGARPPSNSRSGQGDHIVAYTLIQHAIAQAVFGKQVDTAGTELAELITNSKSYVKKAAINNHWHASADHLISSLQGIDMSDELSARATLSAGANNAAILLNIMPGATKKNARSTKGHGEGSTIGGLVDAEKKRKQGTAITGNPWVNILGLIDLGANPDVLNDSDKLEQKVRWLMTLVSHTAPTLYTELEANYTENGSDPQLTAAALSAYSAIKAIEIAGYIGNFMSS